MRIQELINKLRDVEDRMDTARNRVEVFKSIAEKTTSSLNVDKVPGCGSVTSHEDAVIRLIEAEEALDKIRLEYNQMIDDILAVIAQLRSADQRMVAVDFIINNEKGVVIAKKRFMSVRNVYRLYKEACSIMDKYLAAA